MSSRLSSETIFANDRHKKATELLKQAIDDKYNNRLSQIKSAKASNMIQKVVKNLKLIKYDLSHVVNSGTSHFLKLRVTGWEELKDYREQVAAACKRRQNKA